MNYICLSDGFKKRQLVSTSDDVYKIIGNNIHRDWYTSIFVYNEQHRKDFIETGHLAGISDVYTTKIVWDLDDVDNVEAAREDAKTLVARLIQYGIKEESILIAFSGMKGYSVEVHTTHKFSPTEFKNINLSLAEGLATNDKKIYDTARIFRVVGTKHNKTDCYKFPLSLTQLSEVDSKTIMNLAKDLSNAEEPKVIPCTLPEAIFEMKNKEDEHLPTTIDVDDPMDLDFKSKPRGFTNCKYALLNGFFKEGERSNCFMALATTCKGLGYPKDVTFGMLKGVSYLQAERNACDVWPKEELWNIVIEQVYGPTWKGGTYSCKNQEFLKDICTGLGPFGCKHGDEYDGGFIYSGDMSKQFEDYSVNIEKNTIKTGLQQLDDNVQLTIGMPVALLGSPASGKTSLCLNILNNTSLAGLSSAFFSMDMYGPLVYQKQIQKAYGHNSSKVHDIFKHDKKRAEEINNHIKEQYKNVKFSLKSGYSVQQMREIISDHEQRVGDKVKLVMIDYLECISGPFNDATANTSKIAGELRDFATETGVCVITLVQPPKSAGDASSPLTSMRQIKGSSMLEQSFRVILGIHRDGFGPGNQDRDKYLTINALKNTMGPLFSNDNFWDGVRGSIRPLTDIEEDDLKLLRKTIANEKASRSGGWNEEL